MLERLLKKAGFTLLELLVVVIIIGILASTAIVGLQEFILRADYAEALTAVDTLFQAEMVYLTEHSVFTDDLQALDVNMLPLKRWEIIGLARIDLDEGLPTRPSRFFSFDFQSEGIGIGLKSRRNPHLEITALLAYTGRKRIWEIRRDRGLKREIVREINR